MSPKPIYDDKVREEICERLAEGEPLRQICRGGGMPSWRTVYFWMEQDSDFAARIARAREVGHDAISEECMEIADDEPKEALDVNHAKLRVWTRLQLLAKWNPKRYGAKVELGGDMTLRRTVAEMTDEELAAIAARARTHDDTESGG